MNGSAGIIHKLVGMNAKQIFDLKWLAPFFRRIEASSGSKSTAGTFPI
jgi:hypothetical protein